jgi:hypothetical protein
MRRKGQSAVEYLTMVTLSLLIIIPTAYYVLSYAQDIQSKTQTRQLGVVGSRILSTVEEVYASERGSFIRLTLELPETVRNVTINDNREIAISVQTRLGESDLVFFSEHVNVTNSTTTNPCSDACGLPLGPGANNIKVENSGNYVAITS